MSNNLIYLIIDEESSDTSLKFITHSLSSNPIAYTLSVVREGNKIIYEPEVSVLFTLPAFTKSFTSQKIIFSTSISDQSRPGSAFILVKYSSVGILSASTAVEFKINNNDSTKHNFFIIITP